ncbi:MAG: glycosyltransferase [Methanomassiliicoccales archaeon]
MESLRFLMITTFYPPYHIGGDAVHVELLSKNLAKRGHEVHIVHLLDSFLLKARNMNEIKVNNSENDDLVRTYPIKTPYNVLTLVKNYCLGKSRQIDTRMTQIVKDIRPDIIHHHNIAGFGPVILSLKADKTLYTAHDYWLICPRSDLLFFGMKPCRCNIGLACQFCLMLHQRPPQLWRFLKNESKILKGIDVIIAPSKFMKGKLQEKLHEIGLDWMRIEVIYNFVEEPIGDCYPEKINRKNSYFLYVGALEKHKGILELVNLFLKYKDLIENDLIIVGKGSMQSRIVDLIKKNHYEKIHFIGWVDRNTLSTLYQCAEAVIVPSQWYENCPLVVLEAMSHGIPVIARNFGGLSEIVSQIDEKLLYTKPEDLINILQNFQESNFDACKIQQIVREKFSVGKFLMNYVELLGDGITVK